MCGGILNSTLDSIYSKIEKTKKSLHLFRTDKAGETWRFLGLQVDGTSIRVFTGTGLILFLDNVRQNERSLICDRLHGLKAVWVGMRRNLPLHSVSKNLLSFATSLRCWQFW